MLVYDLLLLRTCSVIYYTTIGTSDVRNYLYVDNYHVVVKDESIYVKVEVDGTVGVVIEVVTFSVYHEDNYWVVPCYVE